MTNPNIAAFIASLDAEGRKEALDLLRSTKKWGEAAIPEDALKEDVESLIDDWIESIADETAKHIFWDLIACNWDEDAWRDELANQAEIRAELEAEDAQ